MVSAGDGERVLFQRLPQKFLIMVVCEVGSGEDGVLSSDMVVKRTLVEECIHRRHDRVTYSC